MQPYQDPEFSARSNSAHKQMVHAGSNSQQKTHHVQDTARKFTWMHSTVEQDSCTQLRQRHTSQKLNDLLIGICRRSTMDAKQNKRTKIGHVLGESIGRATKRTTTANTKCWRANSAHRTIIFWTSTMFIRLEDKNSN